MFSMKLFNYQICFLHENRAYPPEHCCKTTFYSCLVSGTSLVLITGSLKFKWSCFYLFTHLFFHCSWYKARGSLCYSRPNLLARNVRNFIHTSMSMKRLKTPVDAHRVSLHTYALIIWHAATIQTIKLHVKGAYSNCIVCAYIIE